MKSTKKKPQIRTREVIHEGVFRWRSLKCVRLAGAETTLEVWNVTPAVLT